MGGRGWSAEEEERLARVRPNATKQRYGRWQVFWEDWCAGVQLDPEPAWLQPVLVLLSTRHLIGAVARAWSMLA